MAANRRRVVVTYGDDQLMVEDGNHRLEAIRRAGDDKAWAIVGFESEADLTAFVAKSDDAASS
jgi:hypothetical protein